MMIKSMMTSIESTAQKVLDYLEKKNHKTFSLDSLSAHDVYVHGYWSLMQLYCRRYYAAYVDLYLKKGFETPYLIELLSVLPKMKQLQQPAVMFDNLERLFTQPHLLLPFLYKDDLHFIGFYPQSSVKHIDFIADLLDLNCLSHTLEIGMSQGIGQLYLIENYALNLSSLVLSSDHGSYLRTGMASRGSSVRSQILSLQSLMNHQQAFDTVIINCFFEIISFKSLTQVLLILKQLKRNAQPLKVYIQGLFCLKYRKAFQHVFGTNAIKKEISFHDCAFEHMLEKESNLFRYRETMSEDFYRSWRMYFAHSYVKTRSGDFRALGLLFEF